MKERTRTPEHTHLHLLLIHKDGIVLGGGASEGALAGHALDGMVDLVSWSCSCAATLSRHGVVHLVGHHLLVTPLIQEEQVHHGTLGLHHQS